MCLLQASSGSSRYIDCTPIRIAFSGDASNTTRSQVNAAQESIMSGEALKAQPEAKMSQEEVAANMNPPNIHFEPPVHDEVMNLHENLLMVKRGVCPAYQLLVNKTTMDYCLHRHAALVSMRTSTSLSQKRSAPTNGVMRA